MRCRRETDEREMRLHAQHLNVTLKPQRSKLSPKEEEPSIGQSLARPHCSGITIAFNEEEPHDDDSVRSLTAPSGSTESIIDTNESNIFECDIIELLCENSSSNASTNDGTTCPQISSSTELERNVVRRIDVCSTCKDCTECQQQQSNTVATIHPESKETPMNGQDAKPAKQHSDSYEDDDVDREEASTLTTFGHEETPILVDLTSEESKQATWEEILRQTADTGENSEMESRIMIADSSSKLRRAGSSLATALRDRGPCVIPVQPNRSLPIRPAPPTPTRPAASVVTSRKAHSPIFKLSKSTGLVQMQSDNPLNGTLTNESSEFPVATQEQDRKDNGLMLTSEQLIDRADYILPDMANVVQIPREINSGKRRNGENRDAGYAKEITKDAKKRRKCHVEVDASYMRDERVKNILKEYSRTCSNKADKGEKSSQQQQQQLIVGLWDDKGCSPSIVLSTAELEAEGGTKEQTCNKVVPPLRLKKIIREASTIEYHNIEVNTESRGESNYCIVTDDAPRPESPYGYSATSAWVNVASAKDLESVPTSNVRDKSRRSSPKSDGYKIKYRRNRLRQKLRELRGKALQLSREMLVCDNDTSPQHHTRLRQMMNCYEKQIENVSKLLCKLSASIPSTDPTNDAIVDLDYEENELDDECPSTEKPVGDDVAQVNGSNVSLSPSPEPPKLSPRSPIDYEKIKSPDDAIRDSPPVLPRVYIAIQSSAFKCLKQNLDAPSKSWHESDNSSSLPLERQIKSNTDETIRDNVITTSAASPNVSSSFIEHPGIIGTAEWSERKASPKSLQDSLEIQRNILEDTKTFDDDMEEEHRQTTPPISLDSFLSDPTMNMEIDRDDMMNAKEAADAQGHADQTRPAASEIIASRHAVCENLQELGKSNEALPIISPSLVERTKGIMEYESYEEARRLNNNNNGNRTVARTVTATRETATPMMIGRSQTSAANVTNILQLQSNYYGSSVARDNVVFTGVIQNSRDMRKMTSGMNKSATTNPTTRGMPLVGFAQSGSTVSSSNQQCVVVPKSCNGKVVQENAIQQRNNGSYIMTEQFPTLGNWVARMSKKQTAKSKSKSQSVTLPNSVSTATEIPGLESQKIRTGGSNNAARSNVVNVAPQWNTERWQRQQHQQRQQQQLYAAASSAAPPVRPPGICPPISVTQFYPPNYAIDPYGGAAFGYHPAICPYGDYSYHSRLHAATASPISGYQISPLQDPHAPPPLRQMQHLDKRFPAHLQDTATRQFTTDLLKYSGTLATGNYQHATASLDYDRLRAATAVTQNVTAPACLSPLLLPGAPTLTTSGQQTLVRAPLATYPTSTNQCGRNRMIPDVVAAAAAAAVVAAASFGRQRGTLPPFGRTDTEMVSEGIAGVAMDNHESSQLMATNRLTSQERVPQEPMQSSSTIGGVNVDPRALSNGGYRQLQNLILNRLPYMKTDNAYGQSSSIFGSENAQEPTVASSVSTTTYKPGPILASGSTLTTSKELARKENRNCETPHLGKVNQTQETTNSLKCSNCGLDGSVFKCLGCEAAFYCDERCQTRHWNIHVEKCPKRMPKLKKLV